jgi:hypothetical protein
VHGSSLRINSYLTANCHQAGLPGLVFTICLCSTVMHLVLQCNPNCRLTVLVAAHHISAAAPIPLVAAPAPAGTSADNAPPLAAVLLPAHSTALALHTHPQLQQNLQPHTSATATVLSYTHVDATRGTVDLITTHAHDAAVRHVPSSMQHLNQADWQIAVH